MLSFPRVGSPPRPRLTAALLTATLACALTVPLAQADDQDDLNKKRKQVQGQIAETTEHLEGASAALVAASERLTKARAQLDVARRHLADVQGRLSTARERKLQLEGELAAAKQALAHANTALAQGQQDVVDQRLDVREHVLDVYTHGDASLRAFGSYFDDGTLEDIDTKLLGEDLITGNGAATYGDLQVVEAQLTREQAEVEAAKKAVAAKEQEAAEHLAHINALYVEAKDAESQVSALVSNAHRARAAAIAAQKQDRQVLLRLKQQDQRIKERLMELAKRDNSDGYVGNSNGLLDYPVDAPITSPYGWRIHPIYGDRRFHDGVDFGVACGTGAVASASGTVIDSYYSAGYGNRLFLSIGNVNGKNVVIVYNHLRSFVADVGDRVQRGDVVARTGTTGWSTGCHLHFTVMENGSTVDPMRYL